MLSCSGCGTSEQRIGALAHRRWRDIEQTGDGALHSFHSHAAGLINPLADQRKINVGLLWLGSDMTAMIVIVFSIALALLLTYFIK